MPKPRCCILIGAAIFCCLGDTGIGPGTPACADNPTPPWEFPTPQRMCVGTIHDGNVIAPEQKLLDVPQKTLKWPVFDWFEGNLESDSISPLWRYSDHEAGRSRLIRMQHGQGLRRWRWAQNRFWFAFEVLYGPVGPYGCSLWQTLPSSAVKPDRPRLDRDLLRNSAWNEQDGTFSQALRLECNVFDEEEALVQVSGLSTLSRGVERAMNRDKKISGGSFYHFKDGFDFVPRAADRWTFFMTVEHTMQIWECRSERIESDEGDQVVTHWRLRSEFWVPWRGQFFIIPLPETEVKARRLDYQYVLVRDCGEVYELSTHQPDGEWHGRMTLQDGVPDTYQKGGTWHGWQPLHPAHYLIALLYVEPERAVYGFGPNFYVRLDVPTLDYKRVPCRYVTRGKASWTDEEGATHELEDPFRTIWQCAKVLKEDGLLDPTAPDSVTLKNVVYVDMFAKDYPTEHPLMCLPDTDFPDGHEMAFRQPESGHPVHAVFPKGVAPPENLAGTFILHGHFQSIQNWDAFTPTDTRKLVKVPPKDYQYFVVSSWEQDALATATSDDSPASLKSGKQTTDKSHVPRPTKRVSSQQLLDFGFGEIDRSEFEKEQKLPDPPAHNDQVVDRWYYIKAPPTQDLLELLGIDAGAGCLIADNAGPWLPPYRIDNGFIYAEVTPEIKISEAWIHRTIPKEEPPPGNINSPSPNHGKALPRAENNRLANAPVKSKPTVPAYCLRRHIAKTCRDLARGLEDSRMSVLYYLEVHENSLALCQLPLGSTHAPTAASDVWHRKTYRCAIAAANGLNFVLLCTARLEMAVRARGVIASSSRDIVYADAIIALRARHEIRHELRKWLAVGDNTSNW